MRIRGVMALAASAAIVVGACSSNGGSTAPSSTAATSAAPTTAASAPASGAPSASAAAAPAYTVGEGEGALNLIAWAGYVVGGTGGEQVTGYDWVTPFETETGCKVTVKVGLDSGNMVQLMKTGQYDGVSASGDATLRLIAGGDVAPVDFSAIPNYADVFEGLKNQSYNTVNGVGYGVPHGRGANVLMYDPTVVTTAPDSWGPVFAADSPYKGKVTAYNYAIYIADAALYLMKTQPALNITNPYALDKDQLAAAVALLKTQKGLIGKYWGTAAGRDRRLRQRRHGHRDGVAVPGQHDQRGRRQEGRGGQAQGGRDRMVGHLDDLVQGRPSELHVQVDELHHLAQGERRRDRLLR